MEGRELESVAEKSSLLCSCFSVMENAIVYLSKHSEQEAKTENSKFLIL